MSKKFFVDVTALAAVTGLAASVASAVIIPTVPIGNVGNAADPTTGYGSVAYEYNIGTTEVTNAQYAAFLNAVAATDTYSLYHTGMAGITRSGSAGSYTYAAVSGRANNPVNDVSFWDATRFANWLHNGQPSGPQNASTTEDGAYTLGGLTNPGPITRNAGWQWAVTSENEWYKAAYHQPAGAGGPASNYWLYPTSSSTITAAQANYLASGLNDTTPVGSYAANYYGAFDMAGNVWEWNEASFGTSLRGLRGGSFVGDEFALRADNWSLNLSTAHEPLYGFRLVQVPGPGSAALLGVGGLLAVRRRR